VLPGFIRNSVRGKTAAVVLATTFVALAVNAAALLYYNAVTVREAQLADARTQAEIIGRASAPAISFNDSKEAASDLRMLRGRPDIEAAALYTLDGKLFASYTRSGAGGTVPPSASRLGHRMDADLIELFHPIAENGESLGTVYLQTRTGFAQRMLYYLGILVAVMALALAAALLLSSWLQRAVTGPILAVAAVAREVVERRDFSVRARKSADDETGVLADAMNRMLADLEREMAERSQAEQALRIADRRKDEFLATLAHELRNPLAPIRNAVYIMQSAKDDEQAVAGARAIVERQLQQMVRLVDDLLDVSRITTGKLALRRERVEARAVAASALEAVEPLVKARGHVLDVELPPSGVHVNADPTRLAQVFLNLLNNAVKFTDPGGRIQFRLAVEGHELVARVRDNGIGIAPEMREPIFDMFAQADRSLERSAMGLGVGLSLTRRLVELHGGSIAAHSEGLGCGSEFIVRMPAASAEAAADEKRDLPKKPGSGARHRILVADDNEDFAASLAAVLRGMGHQVRVEHDGAAALAAAAEFRPNMAFLDIGLPKKNGYDLARGLRAQAATAGSILVAVTGWGQPSDRQLAKEAGFDEYMVKPVDFDRIRSILGA
jgi:signal transduction histidine kinase/CheY-like chemotaxis protein